MGDSDLLSGYDDKTRAYVEALIAGERRMLAARRGEASDATPTAPQDPDCPCQDGMFPTGRRTVLVAAGSALAAAFLGGRGAQAQKAAPAGAVDREAPADPTKEPGTLIAEDGGYGSRSQFEAARRVRVTVPLTSPISSWTMSPLETQYGTLTASGLHFERHHGGITTIDPAKHALFVHGMVERPKKYTMADLKRFPSVSRTHFIECAGNGLTEWKKPTMKTVQGTTGLLSTSEWTGVQFATIAREVGLKPGAAWVLAEGADAAVMTRSIPLEKLLKDAILAYGQNGEAIRPEQGYPLRLILPGWQGNMHIKWLRRLEISDKPYMTREETSKYTDLMGDGRARQFTFVMDAKSVITFPSGEMKLPGPGFYEISGLAWSGNGKVGRVEVSTDGGTSWGIAGLQDPILPISTTRFRFPWFWDGQPTMLQSRCTDETGYRQPTRKELVAIRGDNGAFGSIYHYNAIQSWAVAADGSISNVHA